MAQVQHLVSFVRTAEHGSFSAAARVLGLTPAGVSKNVARLEADLGVRLFQRSTRRLALTESGERFLRQVDGPLASLQAAVSGARRIDEEPAGTLKVSMGQAFGRHFLVPLLGDFLARYPRVLPDWHFDNRRVDIVGEGFDAAVGGGFALASGVVARELAPVHIVAVASPRYMAGRAMPRTPDDLAAFDGIMRRSSPTGRVRPWALRSRRVAERPVAVPAAADPQRPRGDRPGGAARARRRPAADAVRLRLDRLGRAGPPAAGVVRRCRPALALLPEPPHAAGQDPGVRRFRRRALSLGGLRAAGGWPLGSTRPLGFSRLHAAGCGIETTPMHSSPARP